MKQGCRHAPAAGEEWRKAPTPGKCGVGADEASDAPGGPTADPDGMIKHNCARGNIVEGAVWSEARAYCRRAMREIG
jgi:hypothetical protein